MPSYALPVGPVPALINNPGYPPMLYPGLFGPWSGTTYIASLWVLICGC